MPEQDGPDPAPLVLRIDGKNRYEADPLLVSPAAEQERHDPAFALGDHAQLGVEVVCLQVLLAELLEGLGRVIGSAGEARIVERVQTGPVTLHLDGAQVQARRRGHGRTDPLERADQAPVAAGLRVASAREQRPRGRVGRRHPLAEQRVSERALAPLRPVEQTRADPAPFVLRRDHGQRPVAPHRGVGDDPASLGLDHPHVVLEL